MVSRCCSCVWRVDRALVIRFILVVLRRMCVCVWIWVLRAASSGIGNWLHVNAFALLCLHRLTKAKISRPWKRKSVSTVILAEEEKKTIPFKVNAQSQQYCEFVPHTDHTTFVPILSDFLVYLVLWHFEFRL